MFGCIIELLFQKLQRLMSGRLIDQEYFHQDGSPDEDNQSDKQQDQQDQQDARPFSTLSPQQSSYININNRLNILIAILIILIVGSLMIHRILFDDELSIDSQMLQGRNRQQASKNINSESMYEISDSSEATQQQKQMRQELVTSHGIINPAQNVQKNTVSRYNLSDFITEKPYIEAPPDIKKIFDEMITRDPFKYSKPNPIFLPSQKTYFAYNLFLHPDNLQYQRAEFFYYDNKYNISQYAATESQIPLCVIAPGRNIVSDEQYKRFIQSIAHQNYTNFKVIYIDDASSDDSPAILRKYIKNQFPALIDKLVIVENKERVYALANRNNAIRKQCQQNDIVLDVDADDALIGKYAFQFINAIYHNESLWQANSVFIYISPEKKEITMGPPDGIPEDLLKSNSYRGSKIWKSEELRSYRAKLFWKIDENDFKDQNGKFYEWASDHFIQEPLTQLSGYEHYGHFFEILYYYDWQINWKTIYRRRHFRDIAWTQRPYKPLKSLQDEAEKVEKFTISPEMRKEYDRNVQKGRREAAKNGDPVPF